MTHKNEFVTEMIVNVVMLTGLDKNVRKISFFNINVSNFFLNKNVSNFFIKILVRFHWEKMSVS